MRHIGVIVGEVHGNLSASGDSQDTGVKLYIAGAKVDPESVKWTNSLFYTSYLKRATLEGEKAC